MVAARYMCMILGEDFDKFKKFHPSTKKRLVTFGLAIHIPILLWAISGYVIARSVFGIEQELSIAVASLCSLAIYLVERIVLSTPQNTVVNVLRFMMGLVIAVLGASTVDLVIFNKEISEQLYVIEQRKIQKEHDTAIAPILTRLNEKRNEWQRIQEAANCEANGTCGSGVPSIGPVYRALAAQAKMLRQDYLLEKQTYDSMLSQLAERLAKAKRSTRVISQAGLLARVQALHDYTMKNTAALVAWALFFLLVLFFELMVVIVKVVFGTTVDDELDKIRECISQERANAYISAISNPQFEANSYAKSAI
jgi:hypothetical protein